MDFHALRGTAATNPVPANVAPAVTMAVLGHRNIATTMKHYTPVEVEHKKQDMQAVFGPGRVRMPKRVEPGLQPGPTG